MSVMTETANTYREAFDALQSRGGAPEWVAELRAAGWKRFDELGFPTLKHEDWRFTNVRGIAEGRFRHATADPSANVPSGREFAELEGPRLVFVDGHYREDLSTIGELPAGVVVTNLATALVEHEALVRPHLEGLDPGEEAFTALNQAFLEDGVFVHVPDRTELPGVVEARFVSSAGTAMTHPRSLVVLGESASATVIEDWTSGEGNSEATLTNAVTQYVVGANGRGRHYLLEREHEETYVVSTLYVSQQRDTDFASHSALIGGKVVRNNVFPSLFGEGCMSVVNGMYIPHDTQLHDNRMRVRHAEPNCESRQYYRGILADKAKAMFSGRIVVDEDAQQTDAVQSNKNLLLSPDAIVETKPQLEIYADDVKCTHGATIGEIDENEIYYFRSRGIREEDARRMLTFAFVNEIFERMELEPVRARLQTIVADRLAETMGGA